MKLAGVLVLGLLVACGGSNGDDVAALSTSNQTRAPAAKSDAGAANTTDSAGTDSTAVTSTSDAAVAPKASTFTMVKTCADDTAGSCTFTANITAETESSITKNCIGVVMCEDEAGALALDADATSTVCAAMGKSLKPEMGQVLECLGNQLCSGSTTTCAIPAPTTLGDQLCAAIGSACENDQVWFDCTADGHDTWNGLGGELRTDAANAGLSCLAYDCTTMRACLDAWQTAIGFPSATP